VKVLQIHPRPLTYFPALFFILIILTYLLISCSYASADDEFSVYQGMGFLFQYPANWTISISGSHVAGNISIMSSSARINMIWMRDPGLSRESILDQIAKTYNQGDVNVISLKQGKISVRTQEVETLDLVYAFKEHKAKKHMAVWTSNGSDRLFFVSMSSSEEGYTRNQERFNQILSTFRDMESKEIYLESRSVQDDVWAIVLGDLLASYHYKDQRPLQSMAVYAEADHSLIPNNGSYMLYSEENIRSEISEMAAIRSAAVQKLLVDSGYDSSLIQKGGQIWVVAKDPSGRWQSVSLNPKEPWRMVGALITNSDGYQGVMYMDIMDLAADNLPKLDVSPDYSWYVQKDCDPPRYVELKHPASENRSWMDDLQNILNSYSYPKKYQKDIFDCSNTSQICWALLTGKGYNARLMFSYKDHLLGQHMWVVIRYPYEEEAYVAVEATNTDGSSDLVHLGKLTLKNEYYSGIMYNTSMQYSWLHPEEGMWLGPES
jgi:hypothetical protein